MQVGDSYAPPTLHTFINESHPLGGDEFMADTLYGLHTLMDAAAEPAGAVQVSAAESYVHPPMHCPFNARFASVQHNGVAVGVAVGIAVGPAVGPAVGVAIAVNVADKSPNSPPEPLAVAAADADDCAVSPLTAEPPPCAS